MWEIHKIILGFFSEPHHVETPQQDFPIASKVYWLSLIMSHKLSLLIFSPTFCLLLLCRKFYAFLRESCAELSGNLWRKVVILQRNYLIWGNPCRILYLFNLCNTHNSGQFREQISKSPPSSHTPPRYKPKQYGDGQLIKPHTQI